MALGEAEVSKKKLSGAKVCAWRLKGTKNGAPGAIKGGIGEPEAAKRKAKDAKRELGLHVPENRGATLGKSRKTLVISGAAMHEGSSYRAICTMEL